MESKVGVTGGNSRFQIPDSRHEDSIRNGAPSEARGHVTIAESGVQGLAVLNVCPLPPVGASVGAVKRRSGWARRLASLGSVGGVSLRSSFRIPDSGFGILLSPGSCVHPDPEARLLPCAVQDVIWAPTLHPEPRLERSGPFGIRDSGFDEMCGSVTNANTGVLTDIPRLSRRPKARLTLEGLLPD